MERPVGIVDGSTTIKYELVEKGKKVFCLPVDKKYRHNYGEFILDFMPYQDKPCPKCGVYGIVSTLAVGGLKCAYCGHSYINHPTPLTAVEANTVETVEEACCAEEAMSDYAIVCKGRCSNVFSSELLKFEGKRVQIIVSVLNSNE